MRQVWCILLAWRHGVDRVVYRGSRPAPNQHSLSCHSPQECAKKPRASTERLVIVMWPHACYMYMYVHCRGNNWEFKCIYIALSWAFHGVVYGPCLILFYLMMVNYEYFVIYDGCVLFDYIS